MYKKFKAVAGTLGQDFSSLNHRPTSGIAGPKGLLGGPQNLKKPRRKSPFVTP
jgi:hypothetical protein